MKKIISHDVLSQISGGIGGFECYLVGLASFSMPGLMYGIYSGKLSQCWNS